VKQLTKIQIRRSKALTLLLRHKPQQAGLKLDDKGWRAVSDLLAGWQAAGFSPELNRRLLLETVELCPKQRFALSEDGERIRASQGHSIGVDLGLDPLEPPALLWHGTAEKSLEAILAEGLIKGRRDHVHLSPDRETAAAVGRRHGRLVLLRIDSAAMAAAGFSFYVSANGVWLTESVPPEFIFKE